MTSIQKFVKPFVNAVLFAAVFFMLPHTANAQRPSLGGIDAKLDQLLAGQAGVEPFQTSVLVFWDTNQPFSSPFLTFPDQVAVPADKSLLVKFVSCRVSYQSAVAQNFILNFTAIVNGSNQNMVPLTPIEIFPPVSSNRQQVINQNTNVYLNVASSTGDNTDQTLVLTGTRTPSSGQGSALATCVVSGLLFPKAPPPAP